MTATLSTLRTAFEDFAKRTAEYGITVTTTDTDSCVSWEFNDTRMLEGHFLVLAHADADHAAVINTWMNAEDGMKCRDFVMAPLDEVIADLDLLGDEVYELHVRHFPDA